MNGAFNRDALPDWIHYADREGLALIGKGTWRTTRCDLHGGSDSLRVNTDTGGWCCMSCGASGGDTLSHHMQFHGIDFIAAAQALGAWVNDGKPTTYQPRQRTLAARDALDLLVSESLIVFVVGSDMHAKRAISTTDWNRLRTAIERIQMLGVEAQS